MKKCLFIWALTLVLSGSAAAQSKSFTLGKWVEVHNAILKELSRSYVDSLEVGRIQRAAVDAMLEALDPYTVYVPEEEQETFQMMLSNTYGGIGAVIYKPDLDGNVIINEPYEDSPSARAGLSCGDEILTIDGLSTHGLKSQECTEKMRGKPGTTVRFQVKKPAGRPGMSLRCPSCASASCFLLWSMSGWWTIRRAISWCQNSPTGWPRG